jgi:WD repeat-containing protein 19
LLAAVILAFQREYGDIMAHAWFGDGFMLVAFSEGFIVSISTHMQVRDT